MALKGNCRAGDGRAAIWESLLDLKPQSLLVEPPSVYSKYEVRFAQNKTQGPEKKCGSLDHSSLFLDFFLAVSFTLVTRFLLQSVHSMILSFILLLIIVVIGVAFDVIGTAITAADEKPFHAKASNKIFGAKMGIYLVRNADRAANFCNDIVGDIAGIVSGIVAAIIVINLAKNYPSYSENEIIMSIVLAGLVSALTVGGKAMGKSFAIRKPTEIILFVARLLAAFERFFSRTFKEKR